MRGILASLLVAFFGFSLIAPAVFAANPHANLPACCRRDGKHHCAMTMAMMHSGTHSGPAMQAAPCSMFPATGVVPANPTAGAPGIARLVFAGLPLHSLLAARTEAKSQISYSQAGQKRGPPAFSL